MSNSSLNWLRYTDHNHSENLTKISIKGCDKAKVDEKTLHTCIYQHFEITFNATMRPERDLRQIPRLLLNQIF